MSATNTAKPDRAQLRLRALCEGAVFVAIAAILNVLRIDVLPNGGSLNFVLVPMTLYALRWGAAWGVSAGCVLGAITFIAGRSPIVSWWVILLDYFLPSALLGLAGIFRGKTDWRALFATVLASFAAFLSHFFSGVFIWGEWMPETFFNMTMTSPWLYSLLYNGSYTLLCTAMALLVIAPLRRPLGRYLRREDL